MVRVAADVARDVKQNGAALLELLGTIWDKAAIRDSLVLLDTVQAGDNSCPIEVHVISVCWFGCCATETGKTKMSGASQSINVRFSTVGLLLVAPVSLRTLSSRSHLRKRSSENWSATNMEIEHSWSRYILRSIFQGMYALCVIGHTGLSASGFVATL